MSCKIQERDTVTFGRLEGKTYCFEAESLIRLSPQQNESLEWIMILVKDISI